MSTLPALSLTTNRWKYKMIGVRQALPPRDVVTQTVYHLSNDPVLKGSWIANPGMHWEQMYTNNGLTHKQKKV